MTLPLASSSWDVREIEAMKSVIDSGFYTMGERTRSFEESFAKWVNRKHAIMVNSGSSANLLAVASVKYSEIGKRPKNPEVIVPAVSWMTTYSPLEQLGYRIKLVDIDIGTFNLDLQKVQNAICEDTVGIFGVNLLGNSLDWDHLSKIAKEHDLWVLEDNCESMGSKLNGRMTGTNGLASTFSFFYSHHICTMEGGMVVTDDDDFATILRSMRAHGWSRDVRPHLDFLGIQRGNSWEENFRFYLPGFNLRPLEISAAIGQVQLEKFDGIIAQRRKNAAFLVNAVNSTDLNWRIQVEVGESSWFTFGFVQKTINSGDTSRKKIVDLLESNGIQSRPIVAGNIARHPVASKMNISIPSEMPNSDHLHNSGFMIGNHHFDIEKPLHKFLEILTSVKD